MPNNIRDQDALKGHRLVSEGKGTHAQEPETVSRKRGPSLVPESDLPASLLKRHRVAPQHVPSLYILSSLMILLF